MTNGDIVITKEGSSGVVTGKTNKYGVDWIIVLFDDTKQEALVMEDFLILTKKVTPKYNHPITSNLDREVNEKRRI